MRKNAVISSCKRYRYALWRIWDKTRPLVMFIGLNPSTADATEDDNTIRRCITFAKSWNFGGIAMGNLFAFRSTDPRQLLLSKDPIGKENDKWLKKLSKKAGIVIAAWGNRGKYLERDQIVYKKIRDLYCLKISKRGIPCHPLYLPKKLKPFKMNIIQSKFRGKSSGKVPGTRTKLKRN